MKISPKYISVIILLTILHISCILLSEDVRQYVVCSTILLLFVISFPSILLMDIFLHLWAYWNSALQSEGSGTGTLSEYGIPATIILSAVNSIGFTSMQLLQQHYSLGTMLKTNVAAGCITFLYYALLKKSPAKVTADIGSSHQSWQHIYLRTSDGMVKKILLDDILFIMCMDKKIVINYTAAKETVPVTLKKIKSMLPESMFVQTHKSYIVNKNRICAVSGNEMIVSGTVLPVGRSYRDALYSQISDMS